MNPITALAFMLIFPGGLTILTQALAFEWIDRKIVARVEDRVGPPWFQPAADLVKLLSNEEVIPENVNRAMFVALPIIALAGALASAVYVPLFGLDPAISFQGDLIVAVYLLSLLTLCTGLAGANGLGRFSAVGSVRALTQLFSYEAPFLLALLGPAVAAGSLSIAEIAEYSSHRWLLLVQPIGFLVALIGLLGKLELRPFDAPEAETEIVAGALTEYSGRGLALFHLGREVEMVVGLTLISAFYLGGVATLPAFLLKTVGLLVLITIGRALMARFRIDQVVGLWWRFWAILLLVQWLVTLALERFLL